jgi:hypothetical protein
VPTTRQPSGTRCGRNGRSPTLECLPEGHLPFLNNGAGTQYFQALVPPIRPGPRISRKGAPRCDDQKPDGLLGRELYGFFYLPKCGSRISTLRLGIDRTEANRRHDEAQHLGRLPPPRKFSRLIPMRVALLDANGPTGTFSNEDGPLPW